jgi:hypothetical protein
MGESNDGRFKLGMEDIGVRTYENECILGIEIFYDLKYGLASVADIHDAIFCAYTWSDV